MLGLVVERAIPSAPLAFDVLQARPKRVLRPRGRSRRLHQLL
jgi:hypothetical protein